MAPVPLLSINRPLELETPDDPQHVPLVQRRVVHLPPALTLSAQLILGVLAGFLGLLLATPLVAAALVIVRMAYVEDVLGDHGLTEPLPVE
jgi:predicted PurR-regulated permease PerM